MTHNDRVKASDLEALSDNELTELNDFNAYGGTTPSSWPCGTALSAAVCPSNGCTHSCNN